jgi:hypothetical protein
MPSRPRSVGVRLATLVLLSALAGCGTTRSTDTSRTATEQLLISDAVDRAVSDINFRVLAGRKVHLDPQFLKVANPVDHQFADNQYLTSTLRQHLLASGCVLEEKREDADFIVEVRSGALGTDRHELLYGIPATNLGALAPVPGVPTAIPEIPFAKRTSQRGVAKLAVFAYERATGEPVWQSGVSQYASNSRNVWVLGIGPFQSGTIFRGTNFAGRELPNPLAAHANDERGPVWVTKEARFGEEAAQRLASDAAPHEPAGPRDAAGLPYAAAAAGGASRAERPAAYDRPAGRILDASSASDSPRL